MEAKSENSSPIAVSEDLPTKIPPRSRGIGCAKRRPSGQSSLRRWSRNEVLLVSLWAALCKYFGIISPLFNIRGQSERLPKNRPPNWMCTSKSTPSLRLCHSKYAIQLIHFQTQLTSDEAGESISLACESQALCYPLCLSEIHTIPNPLTAYFKSTPLSDVPDDSCSASVTNWRQLAHLEPRWFRRRSASQFIRTHRIYYWVTS